jgi:hypothetical protein
MSSAAAMMSVCFMVIAPSITCRRGADGRAAFRHRRRDGCAPLLGRGVRVGDDPGHRGFRLCLRHRASVLLLGDGEAFGVDGVRQVTTRGDPRQDGVLAFSCGHVSFGCFVAGEDFRFFFPIMGTALGRLFRLLASPLLWQLTARTCEVMLPQPARCSNAPRKPAGLPRA